MLHPKKHSINLPPLDLTDTSPEGDFPDDLFEATPRKKTKSQAVREGIRKRMSEGQKWGRTRIHNYAQIRKLWLSGKSVKEITKETGYPVDSVMRAIREISDFEKMTDVSAVETE